MQCECGNKTEFETWTEQAYNDGTDEPSTSNKLIEVEFSLCLKCGEVL